MAKLKENESIEVLPAVTLEQNADLAELQTLAGSLGGLLGGMRAFFAKASVLEQEAKARLQTVATLVTPETVEEHESVQRLAKVVKAGKAATEEHWGITTVAHRLHKCLTGARKRATDLDDRSLETLNRLHNTFTRKQEEKARIEEESRRREAEAEARAERQREAEDLERQAAEAEAGSPDLSDRERRFVDLYVDKVVAGLAGVGLAERIAVSVGYARPETGAKMIGTLKIQAAIAAALKANAARIAAAQVKAAPVVVNVAPVEVQVGNAGTDRTTWKAVVTDVDALIDAVIAGTVPRDVLMPNPVVLNDYARKMRTVINNWPGVQAKSETRLQ